MKKKTLFLLLSLLPLAAMAERETYHIDVQRALSRKTTDPTLVNARLNYFAGRWGCYKSSEMSIAEKGSYQLAAELWGTDDISNTFSYGTGHWFRADGTPSTKQTDSERRVAVKIINGNFSIVHRENGTATIYNQVGDVFNFAELLIHSGDTIRFEFSVTLVDSESEESTTTDLPEGDYYHRDDQNEYVGITTLMKRNSNKALRQNWIQVNVGDTITLDALVTDTASYDSVATRWYDKAGESIRTFSTAPFILSDSATVELSGQYLVGFRCYRKGKKTFDMPQGYIYIDVQEDPEATLSWDGMLPEFGYDFHDEYGEIEEPTQDIEGDVTGVAGRMDDRWWTVAWGKNLNPAAGVDSSTQEDTKHAMKNMLEKYNTDFAYIRDEMGWPPDLRARSGYRSTIYAYGSGLSTDGEDSTATGGWQSATYWKGTSWPCVLASYYPISCFRDDGDKIYYDADSQREAMIHEGIHAIFADMDGCKNSAWFHEAGNTWLQSAMAVRRTGEYGEPGFLDGCPFLAPFMPIECYSGWLQDGSFGGPSAEGVNMYDSSGNQICTWRTYLGGNQYGNSFPIVLSVMCGDASIPWIWRYCSNRVLEGIGDSIGESMMRKLIVQYRARQAIFDIGGWAPGYRGVMDDYFGVELGPEWEPYNIDCGMWKATCYQRLRLNDGEGWLAPDEETTPGWSGANIIPIHVDTDRDTVRVQFRPEDTEERAILCYKTASGTAHYSQMVYCGEMALDITDTPANGIIFCVVCNTDYIYTGDEQRQHHWDYRIRLREGALGLADKDLKWYMNEKSIVENDYDDLSAYWYDEDDYEEEVNEDTSTDEEDTSTDEDDTTTDGVQTPEESLKSSMKLLTGMLMAGGEISLEVSADVNPTDITVHMVGLEGIVISEGNLTSAATYRLPDTLHHGLYVLTFTLGQEQRTYKVIVK